MHLHRYERRELPLIKAFIARFIVPLHWFLTSVRVKRFLLNI
jgi:hypothetical protein